MQINPDILVNSKTLSSAWEVNSTGHNSNGYYIRFENGIQICAKQVSVSGLNFENAWGNLYEHKTAINLGNWPIAFKYSPFVNTTKLNGQGSWLQVLENQSATSAGSCYLASARNYSSANVVINLLAFGTWK